MNLSRFGDKVVSLNVKADSVSVDYVLVKNEKDAFFLENNLIKKNQPKYNENLIWEKHPSRVDIYGKY